MTQQQYTPARMFCAMRKFCCGYECVVVFFILTTPSTSTTEYRKFSFFFLGKMFFVPSTAALLSMPLLLGKNRASTNWIILPWSCVKLSFIDFNSPSKEFSVFFLYRKKIWFYRCINFLTVSHWITWLQATHQNIEEKNLTHNILYTYIHIQYIDI